MKNNIKFTAKILCSSLVSLILLDCATVKKAALSSSQPKEAVSEVILLMKQLEASQVDFLEYESFNDGKEDLQDAISGMANNEDQINILDKAAQAKAHFLDAKQSSPGNKIIPKVLLAARYNALKAGAKNNPDIEESLLSIDDEIRDESDDFTQVIQNEDILIFQKQYLEVETLATQFKHLNEFQIIINNALIDEADILAPKTLELAKADLKNAQSQIRQNLRKPKLYRYSVQNANKSSKLLKDVIAQLTGVAKGSSEAVALKLVHQERKLGKLSDRVGVLNKQLIRSNSKLNQTKKNLEYNKNKFGKITQNYKLQKSEMLSSSARVKFQNALDNVRENFSPKDVSVYHQGNKLIFRLGQIGFKRGSDVIPTKSMNMLFKLTDIIEEIDPDQVHIQGHTDSTGNKKTNLELSAKRARSIARYFVLSGLQVPMDSHGYGETRPIDSNKTYQGRANNRRIDIIVITR